MKIDILKSSYKEYFVGEDIRDTFILDKQDSELIWCKYIDKLAISYVKLDENNWLVRDKPKKNTSWLDDFNSGNNARLELWLKDNVNWNNDDKIWFCISKKIVIESIWSQFIKHWDCFLLCDDDFPITISYGNINQGLIFTPIGELLFVKV